jgi:hypothetical protein
MSDGVADAYLAGDYDAIERRLAPDATFRSPLTDYTGADEIMPVLKALGDVIVGLRPMSKLEGRGESAVLYAGRVGEREVQGVFHVEMTLDGRISAMTMMVRPVDAVVEGAPLVRQRMSEYLTERSVKSS